MQLLLYAANQTGTLSSQPRQRLQPITGVLHALGLVLESLAPWYEPGAAQQQTNQTLGREEGHQLRGQRTQNGKMYCYCCSCLCLVG